MTDANRAAFNNVIGFTFLASVAVGAVFFIALEYIAGAVWTTPFRRVLEFLGMLLIPTLLMAIPLFFKLHDVYHWTHAEAVAADKILQAKAPYLNEMSFMTRFVIFMIIWLVFYFIFRQNSMKQDANKDQKLTKKNIALAAAFIPMLAISISLFSIDWLMSLEPHWFSTMFGVYYFTGTILTALAVTTYFVVSLSQKGYFFKGINENHYYSFGALMFGLLSFWAYIAFSQFMLIWYANLPEENFWYIERWQNGWEYVSIAITLIHFWIPYFMLVSRPSKMNPGNLKRMAALLVFAHFLDLYWLVMPTYNASPVFSYYEIAFPILSIGLIIVFFAMQAKKFNLVPVGDPKLQRGIDFHL
ncbi:MAG: quinol:cytochrome C oxidoreductase [Bacteroidetes bacterium]|nr:quinol:cytochrome C oxidoreductase [Bacteroidota bacterium]